MKALIPMRHVKEGPGWQDPRSHMRKWSKKNGPVKTRRVKPWKKRKDDS